MPLMKSRKPNPYAYLESPDDNKLFRKAKRLSLRSAKKLITDDSQEIPIGQRYIISSEVFFDWMDAIGKKSDHSSLRGRFYFRGERSTQYNLTPSLLRNSTYENLSDLHDAKSPLDLQKKLLDRYKRYTQHLIHADHSHPIRPDGGDQT